MPHGELLFDWVIYSLDGGINESLSPGTVLDWIQLLLHTSISNNNSRCDEGVVPNVMKNEDGSAEIRMNPLLDL